MPREAPVMTATGFMRGEVCEKPGRFQWDSSGFGIGGCTDMEALHERAPSHASSVGRGSDEPQRSMHLAAREDARPTRFMAATRGQTLDKEALHERAPSHASSVGRG